MNKLILIPILTIIPVLGLISYLVYSTPEDEKSQVEYEKLQVKYEKLRFDYDKISLQNKDLLEAIDNDRETIALLNKEMQKYASREQSLEQDLEQSREQNLEQLNESIRNQQKPLTEIIDQKVKWRVSDSKGNIYDWEMPIETYEGLVRYQPYQTLRLNDSDTKQVYEIQNPIPFVRTSFSNVIDQVYDNSEDGYDFAYEVWFIVSQLTTYSYDIGDDPRWALETLTRGGGDCEDTAILIADMLKSSKHTKNWKIQFIFFDSDNPKHARTVNHVIVYVDDGAGGYFLESTAKDTPYISTDNIYGWSFDL